MLRAYPHSFIVPCPRCEGTGINSHGAPCASCNGTGIHGDPRLMLLFLVPSCIAFIIFILWMFFGGK